MRSKLSITAYLFLALYGSTTLQSRSFLKNIENFLCKQKLVKQQPYNHDSFSKTSRASTALQSRLFLKNIENFLCKQKIVNNCSIPSMHTERNLRIFLINALLLHIPLLALTDRRNDRGTNTLAARGLEDFFLQLCCCVSFWFWRGIGFGFTYLCT